MESSFGTHDLNAGNSSSALRSADDLRWRLALAPGNRCSSHGGDPTRWLAVEENPANGNGLRRRLLLTHLIHTSNLIQKFTREASTLSEASSHAIHLFKIILLTGRHTRTN